MRSLTIERWITWALAIGALALLGFQFSSLYVSPIHDSYLWWGDESWLMSEYREQMTSGVFRHPDAYGSSLWIGNPFPFTSMWLTSVIYGIASFISSAPLVEIGRTITAAFAFGMVVWLWRAGKSLALSALAITISVVLLIFCRSFFLTSHSARYDIFSALALLAFLSILVREVQCRWSKRYGLLGLMWGGSLIVSVHVPLLLILPFVYYLVVQRVSVSDLLKLVLGVGVSVGVLYLIHLISQPTLGGETNLSENLRTIPILRPFSWSVQSSNLVQKWKMMLSFAPQVFLMLIALIEGLRCNGLSKASKHAIIILALPMFGWLFFQPAGPSSYLIHFLPSLALAAAISVETMLVGNWQRIALSAVAAVAIAFGVKDAVIAREVGATLTQANREALAQVAELTAGKHIVALNPAQSYLANASTTHFVELPNIEAQRLIGDGYLLTYNSSLLPNFMWEVGPLRKAVTSPELVLTGHYLDVSRSCFEPLDGRLDTIFLQRLDLTALYKRHIP